MMSAETIRTMSRQAARRSAREGVVPLLVDQRDLEADVTLRRSLRGIPFIGDRTPRGWRRLHAATLLAGAGCDHALVPWFSDNPKLRKSYIQCDSSGFGAPGEPALTQAEFFAAVRHIGPRRGYAIVEAGQFQIVIGVFEPIEGA